METFEVTFYCTGKNHHKKRMIGPVEDNRELWPAADKLLNSLGFVGEVDTEKAAAYKQQRRVRSKSGKLRIATNNNFWIEDAKNGQVFHFRCPTCFRNERRRESEIFVLIDHYKKLDSDALLDISNW